MDEKKITIEIRQEVAVMLVFAVVGVIFVYAAFTIPLNSAELWPALDSAAIAAAIYLIGLVAYVLRKPLPQKTRFIAATIVVCVLGTMAFSWARFENQTSWQADVLRDIRVRLGRDIRTTAMPKILLKTLKAYYLQGDTRREPLGRVFSRLNNSATIGSNIHVPQYSWDNLKIYVRTLEPDRIVLVSPDSFTVGRNPHFKNFDGKTGVLQEQVTLTEKGLIHDSEN